MSGHAIKTPAFEVEAWEGGGGGDAGRDHCLFKFHWL